MPLFLTRLFACSLIGLIICRFLSLVIIFQGWICADTTGSGESCRVDESVSLNSDLVTQEVCRATDGLESSGLESHRVVCVVFSYDCVARRASGLKSR